MLPNCDNSAASNAVEIDGTGQLYAFGRGWKASWVEKSSVPIESERQPYFPDFGPFSSRKARLIKSETGAEHAPRR
jgi:hypothetical protein